MKKVEAVVFQDKSWVRLTDYQRMEESNSKLKKTTKRCKRELLDILIAYELGKYEDKTQQLFNDVYDVYSKLSKLIDEIETNK